MIISNSAVECYMFYPVVTREFVSCYNINIRCARIGGLIQAEWHVLEI